MNHDTRHGTSRGLRPEAVDDGGNEADDRPTTTRHASPGEPEMEVDVGSSQDYGDPNDKVVRG